MTDGSLAAFQLADSFLPTGSEARSYALEQFIAEDRVEDAADLRALVATYLRRQVGPCDMVAARAAHAAAAEGSVERVVAVDRRLRAVLLAAELRESSTATGRRLLDVATATREVPVVAEYAGRVPDAAPGNHAVAVGVVAAAGGATAQEACLALGHAFVTGLLGAAQRLLSLGHTDVQRVLTELQPAVAAAHEDAEGRSLDEMASFAPLVDCCSMAHERADRRLFVS